MVSALANYRFSHINKIVDRDESEANISKPSYFISFIEFINFIFLVEGHCDIGFHSDIYDGNFSSIATLSV